MSVVAATLGYLFLCGTLYLIGFWTTFDFDITTYVDILDVPKSFIFPLAAATGLSAFSFFYQILLKIHPLDDPDLSPKKPDKMFVLLSKFKTGWYVTISFFVLLTIYFFSKEAFYAFSSVFLCLFFIKEVSKFLNASGVKNAYIRWLTIIVICFLPPLSFSIGKLESLDIYKNRNYYKVSSVDYITTNGGKLEEVDLKLIGKLGSYIFLTDSSNSKITTINLAFVKKIEYKKVEPQPQKKSDGKPNGSAVISDTSKSSDSSKMPIKGIDSTKPIRHNDTDNKK